MANDYIPRPDARFHARRNNFVVCVNGHLADWGLAPGAMGADIWGRERGRLVREAATRRRLRPLPVGHPRKRKVEKKRGQKWVAVGLMKKSIGVQDMPSLAVKNPSERTPVRVFQQPHCPHLF